MRRVSAILFPLGVRLSTWLAFSAFVVLAVYRRDRQPLLAAAAWLVSFEALFQIASICVGVLPLGLFPPVFFLTLAALTLPWLNLQGVRPDWRILCVAVVALVVWTAIGLPINGHRHGLFSFHEQSLAGFDPTAEVLNELAKTLWAVAFFVPLLSWAPRLRRPQRGVSAIRSVGG
jgi:hypothetical protein